MILDYNNQRITFTTYKKMTNTGQQLLDIIKTSLLHTDKPDGDTIIYALIFTNNPSVNRFIAKWDTIERPGSAPVKYMNLPKYDEHKDPNPDNTEFYQFPNGEYLAVSIFKKLYCRVQPNCETILGLLNRTFNNPKFEGEDLTIDGGLGEFVHGCQANKLRIQIWNNFTSIDCKNKTFSEAFEELNKTKSWVRDFTTEECLVCCGSYTNLTQMETIQVSNCCENASINLCLFCGIKLDTCPFCKNSSDERFNKTLKINKNIFNLTK